MIHYIIMVVMDNRCIMYSGIAYDIDPNGIVGSDRWSYALYISPCIKPIEYDKIWKNVQGKSSISYHTGEKVCEIQTTDDILLVRLYLDNIINMGYEIEYTYIIKRVEGELIKMFSDTIRETIKDKEQFIQYLCNVFT